MFKHTIAPLSIALSLLLGGCAQVFPEVPLSAEDKQSETQLKSMSDNDAKLALAQMYFMHNRIDEAGQLLSQLAQADGKNPQVIAWQGANNCKLAGRRGPWLMGMDKLYLVKGCLDQIEGALTLAPDDFTVQMVQMATGAEVNMFGSLERAQKTMQKVDAALSKQANGLPADALAQFQVVAARIERLNGQIAAARTRLDKASTLAQTPSTRTQISLESQQLQAS